MIFLYLIGMLFVSIITCILYIIKLPFEICITFIIYLQEKITMFGINILYQYKKRHK